jgi:undecaprenyl-diphosphatase
MFLLSVVVLAIIQGLAELLPVSSSAHVVVAEKLMGLDPSTPAMTLVLVMLHTGTMFAVIVYFWSRWKHIYFSSAKSFGRMATRMIAATLLTGIIGYGTIGLIENTVLRKVPHAQIEDLFGHLEWIAPALAAVGVLIIVSGVLRRQADRSDLTTEMNREMTLTQAGWIGAVQGVCLPFRGFSRSGATISTAMLTGVTKARAEVFSFALAVILTPPAILREVLRVLHQQQAQSQLIGSTEPISSMLLPSIIGMVCSFVAGLLALKWLSRWLESDRWYLFGVYCITASVLVYALYRAGY